VCGEFDQSRPNAAYIAAANPAVLLALSEGLRAFRRELAMRAGLSVGNSANECEAVETDASRGGRQMANHLLAMFDTVVRVEE
jgi:hypothetical protein